MIDIKISKQGISMTEEDFLLDFLYKYGLKNYLAKSSPKQSTRNPQGLKSFDDLNIAFTLIIKDGVSIIETRENSQRKMRIINEIINKLFKKESELMNFLLSKGFDPIGRLRPLEGEGKVEYHAGEIHTLKQWLKWMHGIIMSDDIESSLSPENVEDIVSDLIRQARRELSELDPIPINDVYIKGKRNERYFSSHDELNNGKIIFDTIIKLIGHQSIRHIFLHIFEYYYQDDYGYKLEPTTLRSNSDISKYIRWYSLFSPEYYPTKGPATGAGNLSPSQVRKHLFHFLYGRIYFKLPTDFTIQDDEDVIRLDFSPMIFIDKNTDISPLKFDSSIRRLFENRLKENYGIESNDKDATRLSLEINFLDNSKNLLKMVKPAIHTALINNEDYKKFHSGALEEEVLLLVMIEFQKTSNAENLRHKIENFVKEKDWFKKIVIDRINIGKLDNPLIIHLTKQDIAGHPIYLYGSKLERIKLNNILQNSNITEQNNLIVIKRERELLNILSLLGTNSKVKFYIMQNIQSFNWQIISMTKSYSRYNYLDNEKFGLGNPSYIKIDTNKIKKGNTNEKSKLRKIIELTMGYSEGKGITILFGFIMTTDTYEHAVKGESLNKISSIAIFGSTGFYKPNEIISIPIKNNDPNRRYHAIQVKNNLNFDFNIEKVNENWNNFFFIRPFSKKPYYIPPTYQ